MKGGALLLLGVCSVCTPSLTPHELIGRASELGYAGIEWRIADDVLSGSTPHFLHHNRCTVRPTSAAISEICEATDRAGLRTVSLSPYIEPGDLDSLRWYLGLAQDLNVPQIRLRSSWTEGRSLSEAWNSDREFLGSAAQLASETDVIFALEIHQRTFAPSASSAARLLEGLDPEGIGVIYDIGNFAVEGLEAPAVGIPVLADRIVGVHVKNAYYERSDESPSGWRTRWCGLGAGILDVAGYLGELDRQGFSGWISVEDFSSEQTDSDKLAEARTWLQSASPISI